MLQETHLQHGNILHVFFVEFNGDEQYDKLNEVADGRFTSPATLKRDGKARVTKKNTLSPDSELNDPIITSYRGNMIAVRGLMLDGIKVVFCRDRQANERHFTEISTTAGRMSREILGVVKPGLIAVHGLTMATIEDRLTEHFAPINA